MTDVRPQCQYGENGYAPRCTSTSIGYEQHGPLPEHRQFYCADHMEGDFVPLPEPVQSLSEAREAERQAEAALVAYVFDGAGRYTLELNPPIRRLVSAVEARVRAEGEQRLPNGRTPAEERTWLYEALAQECQVTERLRAEQDAREQHLRTLVEALTDLEAKALCYEEGIHATTIDEAAIAEVNRAQRALDESRIAARAALASAGTDHSDDMHEIMLGSLPLHGRGSAGIIASSSSGTEARPETTEEQS